jgi:hypothetical protein
MPAAKNEFGNCPDPDLAGVGFLSSIVGLWRSWERASMARKEVVGSISTAPTNHPICFE